MIIPVTTLEETQLEVYFRLNEAQLLHYYEPGTGLFIAESPNVILRALKAGYKPESLLIADNELSGAAEPVLGAISESVPVYTGPQKLLMGITGYKMTRGALAAMKRKKLPDHKELLGQTEVRRIAILEDIVNPTNIGAIFRSAAALNVDAILLTPGCSDPLQRRSSRVSMGTVFQVPWTYTGKTDTAQAFIDELHSLGFAAYAMALGDNSISIADPGLKTEERLAIFLGTEGAGLKPQTISACDHTVRIPMTHGVDSLNVACASAVAFWELCNK